MLRKRILTWIAALTAGYLLLVLTLYLMQDAMVFPGAGRGRGIALRVPPAVRIEVLEVTGVGRVRLAVGEPRHAPRGLMLFFVGNGEDLRSGVEWARMWTEYGLASIVVEYPGYGESEGRTSVASVLATAEAAMRFTMQRAKERAIDWFVGGSSLGGASATRVAALGEPAGLLLRAPFDSLESVSRRHYPYLPVGLLLRHRFDCKADAGGVRCRTLIVHGDRDRTIPLAHGRALADAFGPRAELLVAEGHGHDDLPLDLQGPYGERIRAFLFGA